MYDLTTKNRSFLFVCKQLRDHNVKNYKFMLELLDPSIQGLDPYSKTLTNEQKLRIYYEICNNVWYYLREVVRVPVPGSITGIPYELNLGNLAQTYAAYKNANFVSLLPRQQGKTIGEVCFISWVMLFGSSSTQIIFLNKGSADSIENGRRFKNIKNLLPGWLKDMVINTKEDKDNATEKYMSSTKNQLLIKSPPASVEMADKLGRGLTSAIVYIDELAFLNKNSIVFDAMVPAWKTASEKAAINGVPYGIHFTTTPNNVDTESGKWAYDFINNSARFSYLVYDMTDEELKEYILGPEITERDGTKVRKQKPFLWIQYSWKELGRTQEWYNQMRQTMSDSVKVKRELDLDWVKSKKNSIFTEDELDNLSKYTLEPVYTLYPKNNARHNVEFTEIPDFSKKYIISCDVAGSGTDSSVINIIDPDDFRIVGNFSDNKVDTEEFKRLIFTLMSDYFRNALLVVERNSYGLNIMDALIKTSIHGRIFRTSPKRLAERKIDGGILIREKETKWIYGVDTTDKSRTIMFEMLPAIVREHPEVFTTKNIQDDLRNLVLFPNGKVAADIGFHDDNIMSYLIARYAIFATDWFQYQGISKVPKLRKMSTEELEEAISGQTFLKSSTIMAKKGLIEDAIASGGLEEAANNEIFEEEFNAKIHGDQSEILLRGRPAAVANNRGPNYKANTDVRKKSFYRRIVDMNN